MFSQISARPFFVFDLICDFLGETINVESGCVLGIDQEIISLTEQLFAQGHGYQLWMSSE